MSMPTKKMQAPAKSAQMKSARSTFSLRETTRVKSAPSAKSKPTTRKVAQSAEPEDDAFDRAIAEALKAGLLDDMIADALQAQRDGKTTPL